MNKKKVQGKCQLIDEISGQATGGMKFGLPDASDGPSEATGGMIFMPPVASDGPFQADRKSVV